MRLWKSLQEASKRLLPDCIIAAAGCRACPELTPVCADLYSPARAAASSPRTKRAPQIPTMPATSNTGTPMIKKA
jgi:hypothetical protein